MTTAVPVLSRERAVFYRERASNTCVAGTVLACVLPLTTRHGVGMADMRLSRMHPRYSWRRFHSVRRACSSSKCTRGGLACAAQVPHSLTDLTGFQYHLQHGGSQGRHLSLLPLLSGCLLAGTVSCGRGRPLSVWFPLMRCPGCARWQAQTMLCCGQFLVSVLPNKQVAQILSGVLLSLFNLFGGFFIPEPSLAKGTLFLYYANPVSYAFQAMTSLQFHCEGASCPSVEVFSSAGVAQVPISTLMSSYLGFDYDARWTMTIVVACWMVGFHILTHLSLAFVNHLQR